MYTESERQIFRYRVGDQEHAADPMRVFRSLAAYQGLDLEAAITKIKLAASDSIPLDMEVYGLLVEATRSAFGVEEFSEVDGIQSGMLDCEVEQLLVEFLTYTIEVSKKNSLTQTLPAPTESVDDQTMRPTTGCG